MTRDHSANYFMPMKSKQTPANSGAAMVVGSSPSFGNLVLRLREHADRVAGGGCSESSYDPETLQIEHDAADEIERLRGVLIEIRAKFPADGTASAWAIATEGLWPSSPNTQGLVTPGTGLSPEEGAASRRHQ